MGTPFEDFLNLELPKRPVMLTTVSAAYDGDPNSLVAPAIIANSPQGTFYLRATGNVLYKKNDAASGTWEAVSGGGTGGSGVLTSDITYYVATTGSDLNDGLTALTPLLTITAALAKIPTNIAADATISIAAGTYSEYIGDLRNFIPNVTTNKASLLFEGAFADFTPVSGLASGTFDASFGAQPIANTAVVTGAGWTIDDLKGKYVEVTSGVNTGFRFPIASNTATTLDLGMPANTTSAAGRNIQGATFKFVYPATILNHPLTSTVALVGLSGTSARTHQTSSATIKPRGAYGFYGIEFRATTARSLVQIFSQEARFEVCSFNQPDLTASQSGISLSSQRAGSFYSTIFCNFTSPVTGTTQCVHIFGGLLNTTSGLRVIGCVFDGGSIGVYTGPSCAGNIFSALFQGQRTTAWHVDGGRLSSTGGIVFRNLTASGSTSAIQLGSGGNSSVSIFSQPSIGYFQILNCSIGIYFSGVALSSLQSIRNVIIDGATIGAQISAGSCVPAFFGCEIKNCTQWGVKFSRIGSAFPSVFYSGFDYSGGSLTMSGNVLGDFTLDGVTPISQADITAAPGNLITNTHGNYIYGV